MPLEIYKASAGSGKTFRIVREYLKMAYKHPRAYRNILAVTFTNKATAEMKDRILDELSRLSSGESSGHLQFLIDEFRKPEKEIREKAKKILKYILHDYSRFSISTIDSLFQRLIRAFSREMHLNPTFRTEIDTKEILEEAVERLFLEIDQNEDLHKWMLDYTEENLREGRRWDLNDNLMNRGTELFREDFKQFSAPLLKKLADKNFLSLYKAKLGEIVNKYEQQLNSFGQKGLLLIKEADLTAEQFKNGTKSFANHFTKLAEGKFEKPGKLALNACNCIDEWYSKKSSDELRRKIQGVYDAGLNELLVSSIQLMTNEGKVYNTAKTILTNIFSFGLLTDIALKVQEVSRERNLILLDQSTSLLQKVIEGNDSPFIYEKLGSVYRYFMLDEFQDTSSLQWTNLKPLIENSLAEGNKSLIVGDIKQSIYRWRNGDWNLLASRVERDFSHFGINNIPLDTNYRSSKNIINFNNILFRESARLLSTFFDSKMAESELHFDYMQGVIEKVYSEHYQNYSAKKSAVGYVKVKFIESKDSKKDTFNEAALSELILNIEKLQDKGVKAGDIAVLVRGKKEGAIVAKALLDRKNSQRNFSYCYDFISSDTLVIAQSPVVRFLINFFSLSSNPENDIIKADLIHSYYKVLFPLIEKDQADLYDLHDTFGVRESIPPLFKSWFEKKDDPENDLFSLPLYNFAVKIAEAFRLQEIRGELIYLTAFLDLVLQYVRNESDSIAGFLDWWENTAIDKTITLSEGQNAITILTIHKAKGLEFKTVLIPFCNWEITPQNTKLPYLWCRPNREPFNQLDLVLVRYGSDLRDSLFAEDYFREMLYSIVDNLNLLYVALTRAADTLIVSCPYKPNLITSFTTVGNLLQWMIENPPLLDSIDREKYVDLSSFWNDDTREFEYGDLTCASDPEPVKGKSELSSFRINGETSLKLRITKDEYSSLDENEITSRISFGKLLHELFENISTVSDVNRSISRMIFQGKIDSVTASEYQKIIIDMLSQDTVKEWFSGDCKILNERDILRGNESRHRPDRVMMKGKNIIVVDYKTGAKSERHNSQVKEYLRDFVKMGYANPRGYIWYLIENELVEVI